LLTGRENVYLNGRILGMTRADVDRVFEDIVAFSGIEEFIDNPVDTYSSGMFVRLGFAVAVHANPDVFLVDEVLSVGDEDFQRKCRERIGALRQEGKTIVFVSHDLSVVNTLCDRVILLTGGTMAARGSAQETIDFYLRQIGQKKGIHTMASPEAEVISSHGRLSVFHRGREISAPSGFQVHVRSMGFVHTSTSADWTVVARSQNGCVTTGKMPRLPLTHTWRLQVENSKLVWSLEVECERPAPIEGIDMNLFLPKAFTHWVYRDEAGAFPDILPHHQGYTEIVPGDMSVRDTGAYADGPDGPGPIAISATGGERPCRLQWSNTDFAVACRVLQALFTDLGESGVLPAGRHKLVTLEIDLGADRERVLGMRAMYARGHMLTEGDLALRFADGTFSLYWKGEPLTKAVGIYSSMLLHHIWNDSQNLVWGTVECSGSVMRVTGRSRRFPFAQHWEAELRGGAVHLAVDLDAFEEFEAQEYHVSVGLRPEYDRWRTDGESGAFPAFDAASEEWRHINLDYAPGSTAAALSGEFPSVILKALETDAPFRMTAINTGASDGARVLQALRTSESGRIRFGLGRRPLFRGVIRVGAE